MGACGKFQLGDQIMKINGQSTVGLPCQTVIEMAQGCALGCEIELEIVRTKKPSVHTLTSDKPGIELAEGHVTNLAEDGEASKVGIKKGMRIMNIDENNYFKKIDSDIMAALTKPGEKKVVCLESIEQKHP